MPASDAREFLSHSNVTSGVFLVALAALLLCITRNRKVSICLQKGPDIHVVLKFLFGLVYVAGTAAMLVPAPNDQPSEEMLLGIGIATVHPAPLLPSMPPLASQVSAMEPLYGFLYAYAVAIVSLLVHIFLESKSQRDLLLHFACESRLPFLVPILYIGSRQPITLSKPHNILHHLLSDPATEKLLAVLARKDSIRSQYLAKVGFVYRLWSAPSDTLLEQILGVRGLEPCLTAIGGSQSRNFSAREGVLYLPDKALDIVGALHY
ncbi:hypothetical protein K438DRAFT_2095700 [Mycena galopus ATCC 62051]|nr:hypothetical protein K438DRAFT_2095700 [Mycena galopus ATCC 62051]